MPTVAEATNSTCATYTVSCVRGTRPARGRLLPSDAVLRPSDFCPSLMPPWLPPSVGDYIALRGKGSKCYKECPAYSLLPQKGYGVTALSECNGSAYTVLQCSVRPLVPHYAASLSVDFASAAGVDVLLATSDNAGHGLFAMVERVINQILYARVHGLTPAVWAGEHVMAEGRACQQGRNAYFESSAGDNVWEYWFEQPADYTPGDAATRSGRRVRSVQIVPAQALYQHSTSTRAFTQTYTGLDLYDGRVLLGRRTAAHAVVGNGTLVRSFVRERAARLVRHWRAFSDALLGVHVRGTDKVVARKVPPEAYFPWCDAWLRAHPRALLVIATDERAYYERLVERYGLWKPPGRVATGGGGQGGGGKGGGGKGGGGRGGAEGEGDHWSRTGRVVSAGTGYTARSVISAASRGGGYARGVEVLLDALLLAHCDFLLKTTSTVAEFAIWVNLRLHANSLDLQYEDRLRSQRPLPAWAAAVGRNDAQPFCSALARGCRIDREAASRRALGGRANRGARGVSPPYYRTLLQPGQKCAQCQPRLENSTLSIASAAERIRPGERCERRRGHRPMTQLECVAYARVRRIPFLGVQSEQSEFGGCVVWEGRNVEFNAHKEAALNGCNVGAGRGVCLCVRAGRRERRRW